MSKYLEVKNELLKKYLELGIEYYDSKRLKREIDKQYEENLIECIRKAEKELFYLSEHIIDENDNICPKCKTRLDENAFFCKNCGTNIKEYFEKIMIKCSYCGSLINNDSNYCCVCGSNLNGGIEE